MAHRSKGNEGVTMDEYDDDRFYEPCLDYQDDLDAGYDAFEDYLNAFGCTSRGRQCLEDDD
jgi:hypothetical protein